MSGDWADARESIALTDLYIRVAYTLALAESHRTGGPQLRALPTPGVGGMLALLRGVRRWTPPRRPDGIHQAVTGSASGLLDKIDAFRVGRFASFKALRDELSHGYALPADDAAAADITNALLGLCDDLKQALKTAFANAALELRNDEPTLVAERGAVLVLTPLWSWLDHEPFAGVYSHADNDKVYLLAPGVDAVPSVPVSAIAAARRELLAEPRTGRNPLSPFVREVVRDIASFTEDYSAPSYFFGDDEETGFIHVPWTRSTSDQNQSRLDVFRVGLNNEYQWRHPNGDWTTYTSFLKEIANWPLLSRRVGIGLRRFAEQRREEESARLGSSANDNSKGPSRLLEVDEELVRDGARPEFVLRERADKACEVVKPSTAVFFVVGQAGLGKTELMLSEAMQRAEHLTSDPSRDVPLYLFVSSTGRTLASLEDAVDGALNITKLLSSQSAKALCRNGLLVLFVDGFDELLGSSGYENALGSLEPWLRELGGRGVLVASARSSYYLTQYRRSLSETVGINVNHTLAEVQPWSMTEARDFLRQLGAPESAYSSLSDRDWRLLGIPFFAKAFAAWHATHDAGQADLSIFDIVVDQYLQRESVKLSDPHQGPLLDTVELREFFTEIAEMMQREKTRELEFADLVACVQLAVGEEALDDVRPGLTRRISSLCGLGVQTSAQASSKFTFSHEIMFDCFFSLALQGRVKAGTAPEVLKGLLEKGKIQAAVFEWMVEREPEASRTSIERLMQTMPDGAATTILGENVGSWWISLARSLEDVPPTTIARGIRIKQVKLAEHGWSSVRLEHCAIGTLTVPMGGPHRIGLAGTVVEILECATSATLGKTIHDVDPNGIHALLVERSFTDAPAEIRAKLIEVGVLQAAPTANNDDAVEAAEFFLEKLTARIDVQVVAFAVDHLTDDDRLRWTHRLGDDAWIAFVARLVDHGLARWEPITTSGPAKERLAFEVPVASIARRDRNDPRVPAFWASTAAA